MLLSVNDEQGVRAIMDELLGSTKSDKLAVRRAAVALLSGFCSHTKADYLHYVPQLLRGLIHLFTDTDPGVLNAGTYQFFLNPDELVTLKRWSRCKRRARRNCSPKILKFITHNANIVV